MKSNTRFNNNLRGIECLNCKQPISNRDNFCSNCGQVNDLKPLSIKQYLNEFLSGFFSFDTRTFNTILPLITKPGKVSLNYITGKRMKYVNPFQLYLHTSIIFFLIISFFMSLDRMDELLTSDKDKIEKNLKVEKDGKRTIISFNSREIKKSDKKNLPIINAEKMHQLIEKEVDSIIELPKFKKIIASNNPDKEKELMGLYYENINTFISKTKKEYQIKTDSLKNLDSLKNTFVKISNKKFKEKNISFQFGEYSKMSLDEMVLKQVFGKGLSEKIRIFVKCKTKDPIRALDSLQIPKTRTNLYLYTKTHKLKDMLGKSGEELRQNFSKTYISKIPIVLFFTLPFFTLFLTLFYIRSKFNYTEHLIFVFHQQTVFFIILLLATILDRIFNINILTTLSWFIFAVFLFMAMKRFYGQKGFKTFVKYILTVLVYFTLTTAGMVLLLFIILLF
jgi:arsenate reductase-like glutaredoxin family protein